MTPKKAQHPEETTRPRKTRKSYNEPGHAHFLTFSTYKRYPLLTRETTQAWVIESLESARKSQNFERWAYVIMPEHVHENSVRRGSITIPQRLEHEHATGQQALEMRVRRAAPDMRMRCALAAWRG